MLFATIIALSSCSIEKRVYQSGYYISGRHASKENLDVTKRVKPIFVEETVASATTSDGVVVASEEYTTSAKPIDSSDSTIEENITSNIHQTNKMLTEINADSIPEEGKILLAKYEKNQNREIKIEKIHHFLTNLVMVCFLLSFSLFIPGVISAIPIQVLGVFFIIFPFALFLLILLGIILFTLAVITRNQSEKLNEMGIEK